ncbi:armadillo-type protein [Crucibulum laeve]|uniref:Armadillo-type protein n=1 Tax=Crucibulum laeve TaxID=68775 RepID=A0A5C3LU71_9AGAR|nr:armadillo-type protein [Crucibulum laeve]
MVPVQRTTKKRPATSQAGPKPKKSHIEKSGNADKKRSRPVTAPVQEASGSDSEEILDDLEVMDGRDDEWTDEEAIDEFAMDEDAPVEESKQPSNAPPKDPNAARESHKAQKILQDQRRAAKPHSSLLIDAKAVWSLARQKNIPTEERQKHIHDLMDVIRGRVKDIVFKHDASRIVQTVVKWGGQKERDEIAVELKGKYKELAQNKYSKFLITKLIRLCPAHRASILLEFQTHVLRLLLHKEASSVLADAFELYANAYERTILLRDFYGKEAALFSMTTGSEEDKGKAKKGLRGVLEGADSERTRRVLLALKDNLVTIFNNSDKGAVTHAIVHRALWEYMIAVNTLTDAAEQEKLRRELFESCQEVLAEMVHTKDGSRVVREFLAQGSAKDRKQILKVLKPHIERMCLDDEAQLVLFTALDVTDDTKLLAKSLVSEMTTPADKLYNSTQGRRSLLYLLVPRTRRHFTPAQIASLAETDEIRARTSKKEPDARQGEVRKAASEALVSWIEERGGDLVKEPAGSLIVADVMLFAEGDKTAATKSLLDIISAPYPSTNASSPHPIDLPHTSRTYKALLQGGHFNHDTKTIDRSPSWDAGKFAVAFVDTVGKDGIVAMCTKGDKNGLFVVAELCTSLVQDDVEGGPLARQKVRGWFSSSVQKEIENGDAKGTKVLLEKIALL